MIWDATATGRCGRRQTYSDTAIQNCLTMKVLFGMDLRQTTDSIESLLCLIGPSWPVPDFSTLSRRQKTLAVNVPYRGSKGPLHLLSDSTGIKIKGEGEWSAEDPNTLWGTVFPTNAQAGGSKRRVWRQIHLGIDGQTLEVQIRIAVMNGYTPLGIPDTAAVG